jgi:phosphoribosylamine--glycine ligase
MVKLLVLGSGGREHTFVHLLSGSPLTEQLFVSPGNAGMQSCAKLLSIAPTDFEALYQFCIEQGIDTILPGPEDPLVAGIADFFEQRSREQGFNIRVAGPHAAAARLEGSKDFAKAFMQRHHIPTARYETFHAENLEAGYRFLESLSAPYVLKADGLAAGKGVLICSDLNEAKEALHEMITAQKFGAASAKVVVEEFLHGIEISVFAVSDGDSWQVLGSAKDYKRIGEGDQGPNTGGMGAVSPVPFADEEFMQKVKERILKPTFDGLKQEGSPFRGFLFAGLMNCNGNPMVIEYNVRMGDPETEAVLPRLKTDFGAVVDAIASGTLSSLNIEMRHETAVCVVLVSEGYPGNYPKGFPITLPESSADCTIFHAGTSQKDGVLSTNGGRVLALSALGKDMATAAEAAFATAEAVQFQGKYFRRDIGADLRSFPQQQP